MCRTSPTTPTISRQTSASLARTRLPTAACADPHNSRARFSETSTNLRRNHELALQYFDQVRDSPTTRIFFLHWHLRLHAELGAAEAFLHAGDFTNAGRQADRFLRLALSTAEPNMQVHAWDVKSRAAIATSDFDSARQCVHNALEILDRCDIPLAGWQLHRTAWNLYVALGDREKANRHRARAQELIMRVVDSFEPGEPLRESFLAAPAIRRIFEQSTTA